MILSTTVEGERKNFHDMNSFGNFISKEATLRKVLQAIVKTEERNKQPRDSQRKTREAVIHRIQSMTKNTNKAKMTTINTQYTNKMYTEKAVSLSTVIKLVFYQEFRDHSAYINQSIYESCKWKKLKIT